MARRKKRKTLKQKRAMGEGGGSSRYAKKKQWLDTHPRREPDGSLTRLFGFQVPYPKPWR